MTPSRSSVSRGPLVDKRTGIDEMHDQVARNKWVEFATAAHAAGYGLAMLGSLSRDIDLIAVPWREDHNEGALVNALREYPAHVKDGEDCIDWRGWRQISAHIGGTYFDLKIARPVVVATTDGAGVDC